MKLSTLFRTLSYAIAIGLIVIVFTIPMLIVIMMPKRLRRNMPFLYTIHHLVYWLLVKSWWVPVTIKGWHNIPADKPVIFAANHQSSIDMPLLGLLATGHPHVWLAWYELVRYPLLGLFIKRMAVVVDTRSPRRAVNALHEAGQLLQGSTRHLMIFPEGGRYLQLHDFFLGFAILAKETHRPVVPVYLVNTGTVCPPNTSWIQYAPITVIIGSPFTYLSGESEVAFVERVRAWFLQQEQHISGTTKSVM